MTILPYSNNVCNIFEYVKLLLCCCPDMSGSRHLALLDTTISTIKATLPSSFRSFLVYTGDLKNSN